MCVIQPVARAVDGVDAAERAAGDDLLHLLVVLAVAVLVADDGLHAARLEQVADLEALGAGQRDRLLEGDQLARRSRCRP